MAADEKKKRNRVVELLEYYKNIDGEVKMNKQWLADYENTYYNPVGAMNYDGMPGPKNKITRQTEDMAIEIPDCVRESIKEIQNEINNLQNLKTQILREISRLELKEKSILFDFYIHGMKWEQVAVRNHYSERQCKNIRNTALEKLYPRMERNKIIARYETLV